MSENEISKMIVDAAIEVSRRAAGEAGHSSHAQWAAGVNASPSLCLFAPLRLCAFALNSGVPQRMATPIYGGLWFFGWVAIA